MSIIEKVAVGYVYVIRRKSDNKGYVGIHSSPIFNDSYFGSPTPNNELFKEYAKRWPSGNRFKITSKAAFNEFFTIEVLEWCYSVTDLFYSDSQSPFVNPIQDTPLTDSITRDQISWMQPTPAKRYEE